MTPKSNHPIEVTLEKNSSGTWSTQGFSKRQLQPWQRLWIVAGIVYLLALVGSYYLLMPDQESIERHMVFSVTEEVRRYDGMAFAGESPRKIFEFARSEGYASWIAATRAKYRIGPEGNERFNRIERDYCDAVADLPVKRTVWILICIVVWVLPMAVLYAIGFVVDWIRRGVRAVKGS